MGSALSPSHGRHRPIPRPSGAVAEGARGICSPAYANISRYTTESSFNFDSFFLINTFPGASAKRKFVLSGNIIIVLSLLSLNASSCTINKDGYTRLHFHKAFQIPPTKFHHVSFFVASFMVSSPASEIGSNSL
jgi:fatty-acid desaturase